MDSTKVSLYLRKGKHKDTWKINDARGIRKRFNCVDLYGNKITLRKNATEREIRDSKLQANTFKEHYLNNDVLSMDQQEIRIEKLFEWYHDSKRYDRKDTTKYQEINAMNHMKATLGNPRVVDLKKSSVREILNHCKETMGISAQGKIISKLRRIFNVAMDDELIKKNIFTRSMPTKDKDLKPGVYQPHHIPLMEKYLKGEFEKDGKKITGRKGYYFIWKMLHMYGLRIGEIISINKVLDIHLKEGYFFVYGKTGSRRYPIIKELRGALIHHMEQYPDSDWLFPSNATKSHVGASSVSRYFKGMHHNLKLPKDIKACHGHRHTWATWAAMKNWPVIKISFWLGHADIKTTQEYLKNLDIKNLNMSEDVAGVTDLTSGFGGLIE